MMVMIPINELKLHPEAGRVPMMAGAQFRDFVADVKERGVRVPLEVMPGTQTVVDGRCRLQAASESGIEKVPVIEASINGDDPVVYMIRAASKRRQLTDDQRAMLALAELEWLAEKSKRERGKKGGKTGGKNHPKNISLEDASSSKLTEEKPRAREQAAKSNNVPERKIRQAQRVAKADEKLAEKVTQGEIPLAKAVRQLDREEKRKDMEQKAKQADEQAQAMKSSGKIPWEIRCGDCIDELSRIEQGSVHLVFADPPYNIGIDYGDGAKADRLPDHAFLSWCGQWIDLCVKALHPTGSLWLLINDEYADVLGCELRRCGLHRRAWVKWYETFGVNNSAENNFNRCSRHLFYCVKDANRFAFNAEAVRRPSDRQTKYNDKRADPAGKILDDVWEIPRLVGTAKERIPDFPTQLPLELLNRIVGVSSNPGDLVLDPFNGSGTTGEAALWLKRKYVGIEKSKRFANLASKRLKGVKT